jgi:hypothetical protein
MLEWLMRKTRMVNGGTPGEYVFDPSPVLLAVVGLIATVGIAYAGWVGITLVALGREVSESSSEIRLINDLREDFKVHIEWSNQERPKLLTIEDFDRAMIPRDETRREMLRKIDMLIDRQSHSQAILERLPGAKEER